MALARFKPGEKMQKFGDIAVETHGLVAMLEIQRPPNNFFDVDLINDMAPPTAQRTNRGTATKVAVYPRVTTVPSR